MARKVVAEELNRDRIISSARELFGTYGYRALTMRSIAKSLGYSHGALYYHFKEKSELLYELIVKDFDNLCYELRCTITDAVYINNALLKEMMIAFIRFGLENPRHYEMMFMMDDEELQNYANREQSRCFDLFSSVIRQIAGGKMSAESASPNNMAWNIFMSLHGFISYNIYYGNKFSDVEMIAQDHVQFLCGMMELNRLDQTSNMLMRNHVIA